MIKSKHDLKEYLDADLKRFKTKPKFIDWILHNEKWFIHQYIVALRHVEYHINTNKKGILYLLWWFRYKRLGFKLRYTIYPNTTGKGLIVHHVGDMVWIKSSARIGKNCTLRPGVVIGKKNYENADDMPVVIGENCNFGLGVRVFGKITIGNNVTIGANSVVTHDFPDDVVIGGIPASIIKNKENS